MDGVHDLGGLHGFGPVVVPDHDAIFHADWEPRLFGVWAATYAKGLLTGNGRAWRERMEPVEYLRAGYYERWLWSTEQQLMASGALAAGELDAASASAPAAPAGRPDPQAAAAMRRFLDTPEPLHEPVAPRFAPGSRVRVARMRPVPHNRCPRYVRGCTGTVEQIQCADRVPEGTGELGTVYLVAFTSTDLFGTTSDPPWTVLLDLWDHYLEAA